MKLKSVYIEKYKNLSPLTIDFELGNGLTMLVGNNGSGKSNVLEAISGIFHDLDFVGLKSFLRCIEFCIAFSRDFSPVSPNFSPKSAKMPI